MAMNPPNPTMPMMGMGKPEGMSDIPVSTPSEGNGGGDGVAKLVFSIVKSLKTLASLNPDTSKDVNDLVTKIQQVFLKSLSSPTPGSPTPSTEGVEDNGDIY